MADHHVLIKVSKKSPHNNQVTMPCDAVYDKEKGYWQVAGEKLVSYQSPYGAAITKKNDIETGEDQKGE